mmetsp:Transcript_4793/g.8846  ORF Transcript_4793/g.8846 Transcript_4793/m.8846 type:complete len:244 (+) Transcript_4793:858-1589(+)
MRQIIRHPYRWLAVKTATPSNSSGTKLVLADGKTSTAFCTTKFACGDVTSSAAIASMSLWLAISKASCTTRQPCCWKDKASTIPCSAAIAAQCSLSEPDSSCCRQPTAKSSCPCSISAGTSAGALRCRPAGPTRASVGGHHCRCSARRAAVRCRRRPARCRRLRLVPLTATLDKSAFSESSSSSCSSPTSLSSERSCRLSEACPCSHVTVSGCNQAIPSEFTYVAWLPASCTCCLIPSSHVQL